MNRKIDNPPLKGSFREEGREQAASAIPARDRGGRMRRPAALSPGTAKTGTTGEASRSEKNLEALGHLLKTKREISGLTRRDVVVKIKIPLDQLEAIEDGRLSSLPPVFAKGFLRAYANELGLDAEAILDDYRKMTGGFKNEPASREPLAPRYVETSVGSVGWRPGPRLLVIGFLLIAAAAAAFWMWPELRSTVAGILPFSDADTGETPGDSPNHPGNNDNLGTGPEAEADPGPSFITRDLRPAPTDDEPVMDQRSNTATDDPATLPILSTPTSLTLTSTKDQAWAEVTVDGGPPEFFWFSQAGESKKVIATESIVVASGTAKDLLVLWDGQEELGPLSKTMATTVRVRFPQY